MPHDSLDDFWRARLTAKVAEMDSATLNREHAALCATFAEAIREGWTLPAWQWRRLEVLQAENARLTGPKGPARRSVRPVLIHYEISIGDAPGALPIRLSIPVLCF